MFYRIAVFLGILAMVTPSMADVIDFEDLPLGPNSYFDGYGSDATTGTWTSGGATFNTNQWGPGWSYSNVNDTTTAGFTNQWAAFTGTGFGGGGVYSIANSFSANGAWVDMPYAANMQSVRVTNTTYAALSMRDGDSFAKKFGGTTGNDPDWFKVTFTGFAQAAATGPSTGQVEFYLADFRFNDNSLDYILDQWALVDLSPLGTVRSIGISLSSSDVGTFGMNTPAYVALDQFELTSVPEPGFGLAAVLGLVLLRRRNRREV